MKPPRIAVSGLHRGENPQPGAGIVRSIRRRHPDAFIVGLVYDAMESGIYMDGGPDKVFAMPYPTSGADSFLQRLDQVLEQAPVDIFIPTLDSEIELLVHLEHDLTARGLMTYLPDAAMLNHRAKSLLPAFAKDCGVSTPLTEPVYDLRGALMAARRLGYPLIVKGQYYDAQSATTEAELSAAVTKLIAQWGAPALLQRCVTGPEFNAMGLGDGEGGVIGLCCIRKTVISDKGKGLGGMTVRDPKLDEFVAKIISELKWRGPFEVEAMKDDATGEYTLIEVNPRFPAWVDFPSMFGMNLPATLVDMLTTGVRPKTMPPCAAGHFYLRHQIEVHGHVNDIAEHSAGNDFSARPASLRPRQTFLEPEKINS
ncbi:MAG: hypothetical protein WCN98_15245 [Verrucomicrobiaceae bacterium]